MAANRSSSPARACSNRTSVKSRRGPGLDDGLRLLEDVKRRTGLPLVTDVHAPEQCAPAAEVVDMTVFEHVSKCGRPVISDATHSVQEPGALGATTGGNRAFVPALARAAVATGNVDGLFFEVHPDPDKAPSDGPNMVRLSEFPAILDSCLAVYAAVRANVR